MQDGEREREREREIERKTKRQITMKTEAVEERNIESKKKYDGLKDTVKTNLVPKKILWILLEFWVDKGFRWVYEEFGHQGLSYFGSKICMDPKINYWKVACKFGSVSTTLHLTIISRK